MKDYYRLDKMSREELLNYSKHSVDDIVSMGKIINELEVENAKYKNAFERIKDSHSILVSLLKK